MTGFCENVGYGVKVSQLCEKVKQMWFSSQGSRIDGYIAGDCTLIGERQNGILHQFGSRDEGSTRPAATGIRVRTRVEKKQTPAYAT
jgi:hypothetical protein